MKLKLKGQYLVLYWWVALFFLSMHLLALWKFLKGNSYMRLLGVHKNGFIIKFMHDRRYVYFYIT